MVEYLDEIKITVLILSQVQNSQYLLKKRFTKDEVQWAFLLARR